MAAETEGRSGQMFLYTDFEHPPARPILEAMEMEFDRILSPIGLNFEWRSLENREPASVCIRLVIVHFRGDCRLTDLRPYSPFPYVLGRTYVEDGEIIPFSDVHCNSIRAFVASELGALRPEDREPAYGRAVSRVLAHEVYHILADTKRHGSGGIGEARYSARELTAEVFHFQERELRKLRAATAPALLQMADWFGRPGISAFVKSGCVGCHGPRGEGTRWGPSLAKARPYDAAALVTRMASTDTVMYRRAAELGVATPPLQTEDVGQLTAFLRELAK